MKNLTLPFGAPFSFSQPTILQYFFAISDIFKTSFILFLSRIFSHHAAFKCHRIQMTVREDRQIQKKNKARIVLVRSFSSRAAVRTQ